jgi:hypothetical protein
VMGSMDRGEGCAHQYERNKYDVLRTSTITCSAGFVPVSGTSRISASAMAGIGKPMTQVERSRSELTSKDTGVGKVVFPSVSPTRRARGRWYIPIYKMKTEKTWKRTGTRLRALMGSGSVGVLCDFGSRSLPCSDRRRELGMDQCGCGANAGDVQNSPCMMYCMRGWAWKRRDAGAGGGGGGCYFNSCTFVVRVDR